MNQQDHPRKTIRQPGKPPRTVRQQLEHDAWTNHYQFARRMTRHRRQTDAGQGEPSLIKSNRSLSRQDRTLLAVSLVLLLLLLFARASAAQEQTHAQAGVQTRAQGAALSEHPDNLQEPDHLGLANWGIEFSGDELPQLSVALDTDIKAEITGRVARVDVRQRFRTIDHDWSEAIYRFPLPAGAAVDSLLVEAGGRIVAGEIQKKRGAKGHYQQARARGMLEPQHSNLFETRLANIEPGEEVTVSISFLTQVDYSDATFSMQLPLTFMPADPLDDHHLRLSIRLHSNMNIASVESRYHDMEMHPTLGGFDLYLADPDTRTERVFELDWKPDLGPDGESALITGEQTSSLLPVGSSVNLAGFSSASTGWKAQLVYSLATLFFAASLLWFSTPSRRMQAGGSPPPPTQAIEPSNSVRTERRAR